MGLTDGTGHGPGRVTAVEKLRNMLADPDKFIACPGVYDGFTARIALQEGIDCLYMVGLDISHCHWFSPFRTDVQLRYHMFLDQITNNPARLAQEPQCLA